jgi:hypothetical protein
VFKKQKNGQHHQSICVQARQMEGSQWSYVPKSDWKSQERPVKKEVKNEEA